jgi:peptide-methionine (S)-S-oxide reductase
MATSQTAVLGGRCFWSSEAVHTALRGVQRVISGYAGGNVPNPSYEQVWDGNTGQAEVVPPTFEPSEISYRDVPPKVAKARQKYLARLKQPATR